MRICILTCVFNDWAAATSLLPLVDTELRNANLAAEVLVVDDGSTEPLPNQLPDGSFSALRAIRVLQLRRNLGTQRAIATGLAYIYDRLAYDAVVVMDADGEDQPADVVRLVLALAKTQAPTIVFAERSRRSETPLFTLFYHVYRLLHLILTGKGIRVGNFSIVPASLLAGLVVDMNLWNHYAAAVYVSKVRTATIPTHRGKRLQGRSRLGFISLVVHGLSAISCYNELVTVRLLVATTAALATVIIGLTVAVVVRLSTNWAVAGWATYTAGLLIVTLLQLLLFSLILSTAVLSGRKDQSFIPQRDYSYFVGCLRDLYIHEQ